MSSHPHLASPFRENLQGEPIEGEGFNNNYTGDMIKGQD
jgi:hypothetical protein